MTNKQVAFLKAMLEESTITKASEKAGIGRKTAYQYLKNPDFIKELNERRMEYINDTVRYLQGKLSLCNETLIDIIQNPKTSDQIKINAINAVFANCKQMTETADIIGMLTEIEERLNGGQK